MHATTAQNRTRAMAKTTLAKKQLVRMEPQLMVIVGVGVAVRPNVVPALLCSRLLAPQFGQQLGEFAGKTLVVDTGQALPDHQLVDRHVRCTAGQSRQL